MISRLRSRLLGAPCRCLGEVVAEVELGEQRFEALDAAASRTSREENILRLRLPRTDVVQDILQARFHLRREGPFTVEVP